MELLPNSKCLTKIKNHLQLGLIRELIGLLPVGKQWGYCLGTRSYTTRSFPISFSSQCSALVVGYGGQNDNANDIHPTTGVAAYIINQTQFKTGLNGSVGTEKLYWVATGV